MKFYEAIKTRRTNYTITNSSPISNERIKEILGEAITFVPSAFHSQSSRAVLLFSDKHLRFWQVVLETLRNIVPADKFSATEEKISSFAAGYGTILFYEDTQTVEGLQGFFPLYAENFPVWSNQSSGMLQFAVWTALCSEGLGVSLQHYNPLIDEQVAKEFDVSTSWKLIAQMPFGTASEQPKPLPRGPLDTRLIVLGDK